MEVVECEACGKPINPRFAKCPQCGAERRPSVEVRPMGSMDAPPRRGRPEVRDPARAADVERRKALAAQGILARDGEAPAPVTSSLSAVTGAVTPHANTAGWMRTADIVLGVIALPFFVASVVGLTLFVKRWGKMSLGDWLFGAFVGTFLLLFVGAIAGWPAGVTKALIGIGGGAWVLRGALRGVAWYKRWHEV